MEVAIRAFGIAKDILGTSIVKFELPAGAIVADLRTMLEQRYGKLKELASYAIAVNDEYAQNDRQIIEKDEIAIIPPVSGG